MIKLTTPQRRPRTQFSAWRHRPRDPMWLQGGTHSQQHGDETDLGPCQSVTTTTPPRVMSWERKTNTRKRPSPPRLPCQHKAKGRPRRATYVEERLVGAGWHPLCAKQAAQHCPFASQVHDSQPRHRQRLHLAVRADIEPGPCFAQLPSGLRFLRLVRGGLLALGGHDLACACGLVKRGFGAGLCFPMRPCPGPGLLLHGLHELIHDGRHGRNHGAGARTAKPNKPCSGSATKCADAQTAGGRVKERCPGRDSLCCTHQHYYQPFKHPNSRRGGPGLAVPQISNHFRVATNGWSPRLSGCRGEIMRRQIARIFEGKIQEISERRCVAQDNSDSAGEKIKETWQRRTGAHGRKDHLCNKLLKALML